MARRYVAVDRAALTTYLDGLTVDELRALVLDAAAVSDVFSARLHSAVAEATGDTRGLAVQIKSLLPARRFLDWRGSTAYARDAADVLPLLTDLVDRGSATAAIPLVQDAFDRLNRLLRHADDSGGAIGDLARALLDLHLRACNEGTPDPRKLAKWLIKVGVDDDHGFFNPLVDQYAAALGPTGLAAYRSVIDERWTAGDRDFAVRYAKERLARHDRDLATLEQVVHPDASEGIRCGRLAKILFEIDMADDGLAYALRAVAVGGFMTHGETPYDLAAAEHLRRGDHEETLRLLREAVERIPTVERYEALRRYAEELGTWSADQPFARQVLRGQDIGVLVLAMISDGDVDEAWATAQGQPVGRHVWDSLAVARVDTHPEDVVPILESRIYETLEKADTRAYRKAVRQLHELQTVCARAGLDDHFAEVIIALREEFARRPTFITAMDRAGFR